ncbi:hypothetical protein [Kitasatospora aureofaciens]|uniref:hypothetical protein n=1 Tax=Kitasatospora aureofaciens TaxID=1894 RepID=UPI001C43D768|nr:hypothetical protein [Kitasatospora aureofaciens]
MDLQFIGIDPNTEHEGSPTVWVDRDAGEIVVQGWKPNDTMLSVIESMEWAAGHGTGIPETEAVVRIPARMIPMLRNACDDVERTELR